MSEYYNEARKLLKEQLGSLKKQGLRVFINKSTDYCYGLISEGKDVAYIEKTIGPVFSLSYQYVPTKGWGDGVSYFQRYEGKSNLCREDFDQCVSYGRSFAESRGIPLYKGLNEYMKDPWNQTNYIEL